MKTKRVIPHLVNAVVIGFFILFLISCSTGTTTPIIITISHVAYETSAWGCMGTNHETYLRSEDGRMDKICGWWGKPGDKISGFWTEGHWDSQQNGFHLCR